MLDLETDPGGKPGGVGHEQRTPVGIQPAFIIAAEHPHILITDDNGDTQHRTGFIGLGEGDIRSSESGIDLDQCRVENRFPLEHGEDERLVVVHDRCLVQVRGCGQRRVLWIKPHDDLLVDVVFIFEGVLRTVFEGVVLNDNRDFRFRFSGWFSVRSGFRFFIAARIGICDLIDRIGEIIGVDVAERDGSRAVCTLDRIVDGRDEFVEWLGSAETPIERVV